MVAVLILGALITLPAAWSGATSDEEPVLSARADASNDVRAEEAVDDTEVLPATEVAPTEVFARFDRLDLRLPGEEVLLVGYHEASFSDALEIAPFGDAIANDNRTKFMPESETAAGPEYVILSSRGRPTPATSAVDVVMEDDVEVLAPISGRVREVRPYLLYGQHQDTRIEIVPDARPDLALVMIHVRDVTVRPGDVVEAGVTAIAGSANRFPFGSQIDRFFDPDRWPHVHIEVKRR
ncbi:MAG: hypothetical protein R3343_03930 [Nitriliruptorales bacterium]|nr:hypothetical protein [Nitriliruptorales bacterium]